MDLDKTIELVTTLDRAAVEAKLEEVRQGAESMLLADVAQQLTGIAGKSREDLAKRIQVCLSALEGSGQKRLITMLELVEINLPNL